MELTANYTLQKRKLVNSKLVMETIENETNIK